MVIEIYFSSVLLLYQRSADCGMSSYSSVEALEWYITMPVCLGHVNLSEAWSRQRNSEQEHIFTANELMLWCMRFHGFPGIWASRKNPRNHALRSLYPRTWLGSSVERR